MLPGSAEATTQADHFVPKKKNEVRLTPRIANQKEGKYNGEK